MTPRRDGAWRSARARSSRRSVRFFRSLDGDAEESMKPVRAVRKGNRRPEHKRPSGLAVSLRKLALALDGLEPHPEAPRGDRRPQRSTRLTTRRRVTPRLAQDRIATENAPPGLGSLASLSLFHRGNPSSHLRQDPFGVAELGRDREVQRDLFGHRALVA